VSSLKRFGLPTEHRMRHDLHFVDQLKHPSGDPVGRMIPISEIDPNPGQPRQVIGDLSELTASIREKGVLEPLLVRPLNGRYQIIAGERRYRAAHDAGLAELPCVVREVSDAETMELALIENLQRKDLSALEEADGLKVLKDSYGYTHEQMAERLGKSRTSITETLSLTAMPDEIRELCRLADIASKSLLLQVVRQSDPQKMTALVQKLKEEGGTRADARRLSKEAKAKPAKGRPKNYVFQYQPQNKSFRLALQFKKSQVARDEIVEVLRALIAELSAD